jgi:drug/metabolite transporter (DMT)-like permease
MKLPLTGRSARRPRDSGQPGPEHPGPDEAGHQRGRRGPAQASLPTPDGASALVHHSPPAARLGRTSTRIHSRRLATRGATVYFLVVVPDGRGVRSQATSGTTPLRTADPPPSAEYRVRGRHRYRPNPASLPLSPTPTPTTPARAYAALGVGIVCIGWSAIFVKLAAVPGPASAFYRMFFASVILIPAWLVRRPLAPSRAGIRLSLICGLFFAGDLALWNTALLHTSAANATLLANLSPLWVGLGALVLLHEPVGPRYWLGMAIALAGSFVVLRGGALLTGSLNAADLLAVGASFFYAAYMLTTRVTRASVDTFSFMVLSMAACGCALLLLSLAMGAPLTGYSRGSWLALIGLGLVTQAGGWVSITYALGTLRASSVSVTLLGQPVLTAIFAALVLAEPLTASLLVGGALILLGIALVLRRDKPVADNETDHHADSTVADVAPNA